MASDPLRVLGLRPGASSADVKRAYRALAKANHPDSAGESALPRFLAIQAAYEQLTPAIGRGPGRSRASSSGTSTPTEPWKADPARARATGSSARSTSGARPAGGPRPASNGHPNGGSNGETPGSTAGPSNAAGNRAGSGARRGSGRPGRSSDGTSTSGSRRRPARKATFGSTTYDEAHDPADPAWQGAAWYGPSSGEYWTVNPREYADPRKHGPEYQARAADRAERTRVKATRTRAEEERPTDARTTDARPTDGRAADTRSSNARAADSHRAAAAAESHRAAAAESLRTAAASARAAAARTADARTRRDREARDAQRAASGADADERPAREFTPAFDLSRWNRSPYRRLIQALIAWPPIGIVLAAAIGQSTGCAVFAASCSPEAALLPWVAQLLVVLGLVAFPVLARVLAGGTAAVAVLAFPAVAVLSAFGGTYDRTYGPASLMVVLGVGWFGGVALLATWLFRRRSTA